MKTINLSEYGPIVSDKKKGQEIFTLISNNVETNDFINLDLSAIKSMATFNAKQIFGRLYLSMGPELFFDKIRFANTSEDLKLIIKIGIQNALEEQVVN